MRSFEDILEQSAEQHAAVLMLELLKDLIEQMHNIGRKMSMAIQELIIAICFSKQQAQAKDQLVLYRWW